MWSRWIKTQTKSLRFLSTSTPITRSTKTVNIPHILEAAQAFHRIENKTIVAYDFCIPHSEDWPSQFHGLALGQDLLKAKVLAEISRSTTTNKSPDTSSSPINEDEDAPAPSLEAHVREALDVFLVNDSTLNHASEVVLPTLTLFRERFPTGLMPNFVIPAQDPWPPQHWNRKMDTILSALRRRIHILPDDVRTKIQNLGFKFTLQSRDWVEDTIEAFSHYKRLHGNLEIPTNYVVPCTKDWPAHLHAKPLWLSVSDLRRRNKSTVPTHLREKLDELGMIWNWNDYMFYKVVYPALQEYHKSVAQSQHLDIPLCYVIPRTQDWPEHMWDYPLGYCLYMMKKGKSFSNKLRLHAPELRELGFQRSITNADFADLSVVYDCMRAHAQLFGHTLMSKKFVIPHDGAWPEALRGVALGKIVDLLRSCRSSGDLLSREQIETLDELKFPWSKSYFYHKVLPVLRTFYQSYGHWQIDHDFLVPRTSLWPRHAWDRNLSDMAMNVRSGVTCTTVEDKRVLNSMNFVWENNHSHGWTTKTFVALRTFPERYGHCDIPTEYVIQCTEDSSSEESKVPWPAHLDGYHLGKVWYEVRLGLRFKNLPRPDRQTLVDLGYTFPPKTNTNDDAPDSEQVVQESTS